MSQATVEVLNFRSTRHDHPYIFPLLALFYGYSTGHIALRITFSNQELYVRYVHNNPNIPHTTLVDPKTGNNLYQVYLSFWPNLELPWSNESMFVSYRFDCEMSALNSPLESGAFTRRFASRIPFLNGLIFAQAKLPPSLILHCSRLENSFGAEVLQAALNFQDNYIKWRKALVNLHNAEILLHNKPGLLERYRGFVAKNKIFMLTAETQLMQQMYPGQELTHTEFMQRVDPYVSFGYPERDSVRLPIDNLELMLQSIKHIADHPRKFPYSLFYLNCANIAYQVLAKGVQSKSWVLPWYVRLFAFTITPGLILQHAIKVQHQLVDLPEEGVVKATSSRLEPASDALLFSQTDCAPTKVIILENLLRLVQSKYVR